MTWYDKRYWCVMHTDLRLSIYVCRFTFVYCHVSDVIGASCIRSLLKNRQVRARIICFIARQCEMLGTLDCSDSTMVVKYIWQQS